MHFHHCPHLQKKIITRKSGLNLYTIILHRSQIIIYKYIDQIGVWGEIVIEVDQIDTCVIEW